MTDQQAIAARAARASQPQGAAPLAPGTPYDADTLARMKAADAAYAGHAQTFGTQPVSNILRAKAYNEFTLPDGRVAGSVFSAKPTGFDDVVATLKAAPEAAPVIEDYAASTLRNSAMTPDGTIDPAKFAAWQSKYQNALRALPPEVQAKFADAASAGQSLADAQVAKTEAMKTATQGAIGKIMGAPDANAVTAYVGQILRSPTGGTDMASLVKARRRQSRRARGSQASGGGSHHQQLRHQHRGWHVWRQ